MQHFNNPSKVLELLVLLSCWRDRDQDGPDTVAKNSVRERWCVVRILDVQQLLHALLGHLLDVPLVALEELEEDANDLGFHLNDIEVQGCLETGLIQVNWGRWRLLALTELFEG